MGYDELMEVAAGCSFNDGIYRLHSQDTATTGQAAAVANSRASLEGRGAVFAYDWLGRQFPLYFDRRSGDQPMVLMLGPGTGEALKIPSAFVDFHNTELTDFAERPGSEFFGAWSAANPGDAPLEHSDCVGYLVPLFLGDEDAIENLEVVEFDVYWSVLSQILQQTRDLPEGTETRRISPDDG